MVARFVRDEEAAGSNPVTPTRRRGSALGSALFDASGPPGFGRNPSRGSRPGAQRRSPRASSRSDGSCHPDQTPRARPPGRALGVSLGDRIWEEPVTRFSPPGAQRRSPRASSRSDGSCHPDRGRGPDRGVGPSAFLGDGLGGASSDGSCHSDLSKRVGSTSNEGAGGIPKDPARSARGRTVSRGPWS